MRVNDDDPYAAHRAPDIPGNPHAFRDCVVITLTSIAAWALVGVGAVLAGLANSHYTVGLAIAGGLIGFFLAPIAYLAMFNRPILRSGIVLLILVPSIATACAFVWPASILVTPFVAYLGASAFIYNRIPKVKFGPDPLRCKQCEYDLTGLLTNTCPECGKHIDSCSAERELPS